MHAHPHEVSLAAGTGSPGFWLNNGLCQWPIDSVKVGNVTYSKAQSVAIMDLATGSLPNTVSGGRARGWRARRGLAPDSAVYLRDSVAHHSRCTCRAAGLPNGAVHSHVPAGQAVAVRQP